MYMYVHILLISFFGNFLNLALTVVHMYIIIMSHSLQYLQYNILFDVRILLYVHILYTSCTISVLQSHAHAHTSYCSLVTFSEHTHQTAIQSEEPETQEGGS